MQRKNGLKSSILMFATLILMLMVLVIPNTTAITSVAAESDNEIASEAYDEIVSDEFDDEIDSAQRISLSKTKATLYVGTTLQLKVKGTKEKVSWKSSNSKVAKVSSTGKVTPKSAGEATITAKVSGKKLTCKLTVKKPFISATSATIFIGKTQTLKLTGTAIKTAKSSNTKVATVSKKGVVTAKKIGKATITLTGADGKSYKCKVTVSAPYLSEENIILSIGNTATIVLNGATAASFVSSDNTVVTVSNAGLVTAKKAGTAIITVTDNKNKTYKCTVTVNACTAHVWDAGKVTRVVTCTADGSKLFTCTLCNETKSEVITATGHTFSNGVCSKCQYACVHFECDKIKSGQRKGYYLCSLCGIEPSYVQIVIGSAPQFSWNTVAFQSMVEWDDAAKTELSATFKAANLANVPETDKGANESSYYEIVGVDKNGFCGPVNNELGDKLVLPDSVKTVEEGAFYQTEQWKKVVLPEGITEISKDSFAGSSVEEVVLPSTVSTIGANAFEGSSLKSIELNSGLKTIEDGAFYNCSELETVVFNDGLEKIGENAFAVEPSDAKNTGMKVLNIPDSVSSVDVSSFGGRAFEEITIGENLTDADVINALVTQSAETLKEDGLTLSNPLLLGEEALAGKSCTILGDSIANAGNEILAKMNHTFDSKGVCSNCSFECTHDSFVKITEGARKGYYHCVCGNVEPTYVQIALGNADAENNSIDFTWKDKGLQELVEWDDAEKTMLSPTFKGDSQKCSATLDNTYYEIIGLAQGCFTGDTLIDIGDTLILPDSVGYILDGCFYHNDDWKKVVLPEGITEIPKSAFCGSSVEEVVIPSTVKTIGQAAFNESAIKTINLPEGLTTIELSAFYNAKQLKSIEMPSTITTLERFVFFGSGIEAASFDKVTKLLEIPYSTFNASNLKSFKIPDCVISIGQYAFYGTKLETIEIPSSVKTINNQAFYNIDTLKSIVLNEGLETIGEQAFCLDSGSSLNSVKEISIPNSVSTLVHTNAFFGRYVEKLRIGSSIHPEAVNTLIAMNLNSLIENGLYLENPAAANNASIMSALSCKIIDVTCLDSSVTFLEKMKHSFDQEGNCTHCGYACTHKWDAGTVIEESNCCEQGSKLFTCSVCKVTKTEATPLDSENHKKSNVYGMDFDSHWQEYACSHKDDLTPEKEAHIFEGSKCTVCDYQCIHSNATKILEGERKGYYLCDSCKMEPNYIKLTVGIDPSTNEADSNFSWSNAKFQEMVEWEDVEKTILSPTFRKNKDRIDDIHQGNYYYEIVGVADGGFAGANVNSLNIGDTLVLPSTIKEISRSCFYGSTWKKVVLPETVTSIPIAAFVNSAIEEIDIPNGVTSIGGDAFSHSALKNISISSSVKTIGENAFAYTKLTNVDIPEGVETVGGSAFMYSTVEEVNLPSTLLALGAYAFQYCKSLSTVAFNNGSRLIDISNGLFINSTIENFEIPSTVSNIGAWAFASCPNLKSVEIPAGVKEIPAWTFSGCDSLTEIKFNEGLKSIGQMAFALSTHTATNHVTELILPDSLEDMENDAFNYRFTLNKLRFGKNIKKLSTVLLGSAYKTLPDGGLIIDSDLSVVLTKEIKDILSSRYSCSQLVWKNEDDSDKYASDSEIFDCLTHSFDSTGTCAKCDFVCHHPESGRKNKSFRAATCTVDGERIYSCSRCNNTITEVLPQTGHSLSDNWLRSAKHHWKEYTCADKATLEVEKIEHIYDSSNVCTECGYEKPEECDSCDYVLITEGDRKGYFECSKCGNEPNYIELSSLNISASHSFGYFDGIFEWDDSKSELYPTFKGIEDQDNCLDPDTYYVIDELTSGFFNGNTLKDYSTTITLPQSMKSVSMAMFSGNTTVKKVIVPEGVQEIPNGFINGSKIEEIILPGTIKTIAGSGLGGAALKSLVIPEGVETIEDYAFSNNPMTSASISKTVKTIGIGVFANCEELKSVTFEEGIESISYKTFYECKKLEEVIFPDSLKSLGYEWCSMGYSIAADYYVFYDCASLKKVRLGQNLTQVHGLIGYGCNAIEDEGIVIECNPEIFDECLMYYSCDNLNCGKIKNAGDYKSYVKFPWGAKHASFDDSAKCTKCGYTCPHPDDCIWQKEGQLQTCTEPGYAIWHCDLCDCEFRDDYEATGHMRLNAWQYDNKEHWILYYCYDSLELDDEKAAHDFDANGVCKVCKFICKHPKFTPCTICGYEEPANAVDLYDIEQFCSLMGYMSVDEIPSEIVVPYAVSYAGLDMVITDVNIGIFADYGIKKITFSEGILAVYSSLNSDADIEEIYFPSTIKELPKLEGCEHLKKVVIPSDAAIDTIRQAFLKDCTNLTEFVIPDTIRTIEENAFAGTAIADGITIGANVAKIESNAFGGFKSSITINCDNCAFGINSLQGIKCSQITDCAAFYQKWNSWYCPNHYNIPGYYSLGFVHENNDSGECKHCKYYYSPS